MKFNLLNIDLLHAIKLSKFTELFPHDFKSEYAFIIQKKFYSFFDINTS